ncbi:MAG TPA: nucleoside deaminase [Bacteroidetes bacterium]|nr:nucleoside deaminase [Bacteroidota bacterium]
MKKDKILNDTYFMKLALQEAHKALEAGEIPIGAVITCNETIIARSYNQVEMLNDPTAHAEMLAITAASHHLGSKFLDKCTLYVTVEPCPMCAGALFWARIGCVVFGTKDEKRGYLKHHPEILHPRTKIKQGVLENEAKKLIDSFFNTKRKNDNNRPV